MRNRIYQLLKAFNQFIFPPKYLKDEYLYKLRQANSGMLHRGNIFCFDFVFKNLPENGAILEIGTFCGLSANVINYYKNKYNKKNRFFTTDKWQHYSRKDYIGDSNITYEEYKKYIRASLKNNIETFSKGNIPFIIDSFSDDFFKNWKNEATVKDIWDRDIKLGGSLSFAYIDGNHEYSFVKRDFENCDKYLRSGGFILFDDSADYSGFEVSRLVKEIKSNKKYKLVLRNPNYLFVKI